MGASYVAGTRPAGSGVAGGMKGPGNGRNQFAPLVSPHVVHCDTVSLTTTGTTTVAAATVTLPAPLALSASKYSIITASSSHSSAVGVDASGKLSTIVVSGVATQTVSYAVLKKGQGA
jgi:hypothetical protein